MDKSCSGINARLKIRSFLTIGGTQLCSRDRRRRLRKSVVSMLGSVAVIGVLGHDACNGEPELVVCEGSALPICIWVWWWIITTASCPSRKGETVPCCHTFKSGWMRTCAERNHFFPRMENSCH